MMVAAGIDATRNLDPQLADLLLARGIGKAGAQALRDRDGPGIGQAAVVQPRAGDDVADKADIRRG